jgi:Mg/Co/Ni transporter MgtE
LYSQATPAEVLDRIRRSSTSPEALAWIFVMHTNRRLVGAVALVDLLRADPAATLGEIAEPPRRLRADAELEEVARLMTDFDLTVAPVVDDEDRMIGVITVDDVLEVVLPRGWRRQFSVFGED